MILNFKLATEYSAWLILVCLLIGGIYSLALYFRDKKLSEVKNNIIRLKAILRFLAVSILSALLLSPMIIQMDQTIEKPIIIIAQDNSESILINKDSSYYEKQYPDELQSFINELSAEYDVVSYTFGDSIVDDINLTFSEKSTNYTSLINEIKGRYSNRNVGAVIIATDGIYNKGTNPIYEVNDIKYPFYTIGLGDTTIQKDILIQELNTNKIAFLGNRFPVQFTIKANKLKGRQTRVSLYNGGNPVYSEVINIDNEDFSKTINTNIEADKPGFQRYRLHVMPLDGEVSKENNFADFIIEVIENKQKILLLSNGPHPDIAALKKAFEVNENFEVEHMTIKNFNNNITDYNLVVLHQLPSKKYRATNILTNIFKNDISALFIIGSQTDLQQLNALNFGLIVRQRIASTEEAQGVINKNFSTFEVNEDFLELLRFLPPLQAPFGDYSLGGTASTLFHQKIKNISTLKPLIFFNEYDGSKIGCICGEGIWKWRIYDYVRNKKHELFDELFNKVAQYLALKIKKKQFLVNSKRIYPENEPIIFSAELYNDAYELINDPEVKLEIYDKDKNAYPYAFSRTVNAYRLNAGSFPPGDYTYRATVQHETNSYAARGSFTVIPVRTEAKNTVADHNLLYRISHSTNGKLFFPNQFDMLLNDIKNNKDIVPISYSDKSYKDIINLRWIFFMLLFFITMEWFFRKYFGSY